jgi:hypothetical protein
VNEELQATQAKALLEDPAFKDVVARLEADYTDQWKHERAPEVRDMLWAKVNALFDIRKSLEAAAASARVTAFNNRNFAKNKT